MNALMFEPLLRAATIRAIDAVATRFAGAHVTQENVVTNLLNRWNALTPAEKERIATLAIVSTATAVTALAALKGGKRKVAKTVAKTVGKRVARKVVRRP